MIPTKYDDSRSQETGLNLLIYPSSLLSSGRLLKLAKSLQSSGRFCETHIVGIHTGDLPREESLHEGIRLQRIKGASLRSFLGGVRIMLFWPWRVYRHYRTKPLAAVAAQNVYVLPLAYHLAKKTGAIMVYNAHELETETQGARGVKKKIAKFLERRYIGRAEVVSVVNDSIAEWYRNHYSDVHPIVVTNTPVDGGGTRNLRAELGLTDDELLYIHVGFLMEGRSIPLLLREFSTRPQLHIAFLGDGYLRQQVVEATKRFRNIHLLGTVSPEDVVSVVRGADAGICLIEDVSLSDKLSTPNKLMEALVAGIPPLSSSLPEARRLLGDELSKTWIIEHPETEFGTRLDRIHAEDVKNFQSNWMGVPTWDSQAVNLVEAYGRAIDAKSRLSG